MKLETFSSLERFWVLYMGKVLGSHYMNMERFWVNSLHAWCCMVCYRLPEQLQLNVVYHSPVSGARSIT